VELLIWLGFWVLEHIINLGFMVSLGFWVLKLIKSTPGG
jgi:hypothetical protein